MVSSRVIDSKVLRITIQFKYFFLVRNNITLEILAGFGMNPDVPAFKGRVYTGRLNK